MVEIVYYATVRRISTSLMITIPKAHVDRLRLHKGDQIKVKICADDSLGVKYDGE